MNADESSLQEYALQHGVQLGVLLDSASGHFEASLIAPHTDPLTDDELGELADDDNRWLSNEAIEEEK